MITDLKRKQEDPLRLERVFYGSYSVFAGVPPDEGHEVQDGGHREHFALGHGVGEERHGLRDFAGLQHFGGAEVLGVVEAEHEVRQRGLPVRLAVELRQEQGEERGVDEREHVVRLQQCVQVEVRALVGERVEKLLHLLLRVHEGEVEDHLPVRFLLDFRDEYKRLGSLKQHRQSAAAVQCQFPGVTFYEVFQLTHFKSPLECSNAPLLFCLFSLPAFRTLFSLASFSGGGDDGPFKHLPPEVQCQFVVGRGHVGELDAGGGDDGPFIHLPPGSRGPVRRGSGSSWSS